jgi:membrane-associated phospholipid phosphatase
MLRRPRVLLAAGALCALAGVLVYVAVMHVAVVQRADLRVLAGFVRVPGPRGARAAEALAWLFDPAPFAVLAAAVVAIGVARGRGRLAIAAGAAVLGASVTTQLLKVALASARPQVPGAIVGAHAWPSGHATAAMSLALALVLVSPARLRPVTAAAGGLLAVGVAYAILMLGWHYPSDVAGGFLVAAGWSCLPAALALRRPDAAPLEARAALGPPIAAGGALLAALALAAAARPQQLTDHTTFFAGAVALAAAAVALAGAVAVVLSDSAPAPTAARRRRPRR